MLKPSVSVTAKGSVAAVAGGGESSRRDRLKRMTGSDGPVDSAGTAGRKLGKEEKGCEEEVVVAVVPRGQLSRHGSHLL